MSRSVKVLPATWGLSGLLSTNTIFVGLLVGTAVLSGALAAFVGPIAALPILAVALLMASFAVPVEWMTIGSWLVASVVAGGIEYGTGISQGFWIPYLMGLLLVFHVVSRGAGKNAVTDISDTANGVCGNNRSLIPWVALLWLVTAVFTTIVALPPISQILVSAKNHFFVWGFFLALILLPWPRKSLRTLWTTLVVVACAQLPVAVYQRFVVAAKRTDAAAWDAVVGTFGGTPGGGGHSGAMALIATIAIGVLLTRWRSKELSLKYAGGLSLVCLAPVLLAEVKIIFVWLPIAIVVVFFRDIKRHLVQTTVALTLCLALIGGMAIAYKAAFYEGQGGDSWEYVFDKQIKYAIDPDEFNVKHKRLGRMAVLKYWWQQNSLADPVHFLVGYGLGASRSSSSLSVGELSVKHPFGIDFSSASTLLWDTGLLGTALFAFLLLLGAKTGLGLSRAPAVPPFWQQYSFLSGMTLLLILAGFAYNRDAIDTPAVQILLLLSLGQVVVASRFHLRGVK